MGVYLKVTDRNLVHSILEKVTNDVSDKELLRLHPGAFAVHYDGLTAVGLLYASPKPEFGLRDSTQKVSRFGKSYHLMTPDRRTAPGKSTWNMLQALTEGMLSIRHALNVIGPAVRSGIVLENFGFDYINQSRMHVIHNHVYIAIVGASVYSAVYDEGGPVEVITRDEFRLAVRNKETGTAMFEADHPLSVKASTAISVFCQVSAEQTAALLSGVYRRVCEEPTDVRAYVDLELTDAECFFIFATVAAILHAFYGVE